MRGVVFLSLVLLQPSFVPRGSAESERTWCRGSGPCYSAHLGSLNFHQAQDACAQLGGGLSTASGEAEIQALLALLTGVSNGSGTSLFWLGLVRKAQQCTLEDLPLRGFSWASPGIQAGAANETTHAPYWVREPSKSCTVQKCAGLQVTLGRPGLEPWGLKERVCTKTSPGYICKYSDGASCPRLPPSPSLRYTLPSRVQSAALEFSPPGTVVTLKCPGREARFTCRLSPSGYQWEGSEHGLCSCPSGYWDPSKGACAEPSNCFDARGGFLCLCARGSRLGANATSCVVPAAGAGAGTAGPPLRLPTTSRAFTSNSTGRPAGNYSLELVPPGVGNGTESSSAYHDSSNYVFILITVAVVMLVILVMAMLEIFQVCFTKCSCRGSQANKKGAPSSAAEGDPEASAIRTNSAHSLGPSQAESVEALQHDPSPDAEQGELGQP
ncbi:C-type lectin domain family 14 member A [Varanus komodoensis]|uniref:C-type lectin domain family 14 member A n=1 Tax=Varanus komodoensis TaxID=61221 RepID=UPI001CF7B738|nr:C-type lectin domain family 14 member A [Varanus komodoensis]